MTFGPPNLPSTTLFSLRKPDLLHSLSQFVAHDLALCLGNCQTPMGIPWREKTPTKMVTGNHHIHRDLDPGPLDGELVLLRRRSDICLSHNRYQWKTLMSCFMPVLSFIEGHFQRISLLSLLSLAGWMPLIITNSYNFPI